MKPSGSVLVDTTAVEQPIHSSVKALGWVSFLTDVHSEAILSLLPLFITQVLGLSATFLGLVEGIADGTASLLKVFSGWYSDSIGRRKAPAAAGYMISTAVKPLLAISGAGGLVLAVRFFDRIGKGIRTAPRDAIIADSTAPSGLGKAYGFHRMMDTLGAVAGTALAFLLFRFLGGDESLKMRSIFLISTVFGMAAVVVLLVFVREKERAAASHGDRFSRFLPAHKRLLAFVALNVFFYLGMFSYAFFLLRARSLGIATGLVPLLYLLYNMIYALAALPMGSLSDRIGRKPIILISYLSYAVVCLTAAFAWSGWQAWVLFALYGVHSATVNPASRALVAELSHYEVKATALGIYHASVGVAVLPASLVAGMLWDNYGPATPFLVAAVLSSCSFLLLLPLPLDER
ncbi:MAG: MFS transporter [Candidatus Abyssobacteria bacterium SURF_5]|jgi:MFS family permease|uniref:MFS transporter n=1 Tax=Abyssobacteria bacterium (strain SURF_5) TaxID=2093360 RepID=A0A3A4P221_ABYX5|nr:MAG: MFS transporter [Candidatus Abyssubacteria bacterium SURF_5]